MSRIAGPAATTGQSAADDKGRTALDALDIFAWIVLLVLVVAAIAAWIVLARLPGQVARRRGHPYADAVNVAGWLGALMLGLLWPLALIWAFAVRQDRAAPEERAG